MTPNSSEKDKSFRFKNELILLGLVLLLLFNNLTGFTDHINANNRIARLEFDNTIASDSLSVAENNLEIDSLKNQIRSYKSLANDLADKVSVLHKSAMQANKTDLWFFMSTSSLYVICMLALIPIGILAYAKNKVNDLTKFATGIMVILCTLFTLMLFTDYMLSKIPIIRNDLTWNYLLNYFLQLAIIASLVLGLRALGRRTLRLRSQQSQT